MYIKSAFLQWLMAEKKASRLATKLVATPKGHPAWLYGYQKAPPVHRTLA